MSPLRTFWSKLFAFNWQFGLFLILMLGIPRFILVLQANVTTNYNLIPLLFIFMMIAPLIFLTKDGRTFIGLKKPTKVIWLLYAFVLGAGFCFISFVVAHQLFGESISNWFVYISKSYTVSVTDISDSDRLIYFIIYSIIGMTFSPLGEELFYRGVVHGAFVKKFGNKKASTIDSLAFAITHLAHFGIVYTSEGWKFLPFPALLWVLFMFIASKLFFICKEKSGSLFGAIIGHASFNLAMTYFIFYYIL